MRSICIALVAAALLAVPSAASAFAVNGVAASTYADGFAVSAQGVGPIGIALDSSNRLFAIDEANGWLYRFDPPGGTASDATRLGTAPLSTDPGGLAFDASGRLYAARFAEHDIVQLDPSSGAVIRTVAANLACPLSLAVDPISGDLFASLGCDTHIARISNLSSKSPAVTPFAHSLEDQDGLVIAPDGTIYVVDGNVIQRVTGAAASSPGQVSAVATLPGADGLAVGTSADGKASQLVVNRTNGVITRIDLTGANPAVDVLAGGSRGDFATVGADGCLYATQTDSILKVTAPDGTCDLLSPGGLLPSTPPSETPGAPDLPSSQGCLDTRTFTFRLHHSRTTRVVGVDIFVNGKRVVHKRGKSIATAALKKLPQKLFRVRVVSFHSNGARIISTRTYRGCKKTRPHAHSNHHHHRRGQS